MGKNVKVLYLVRSSDPYWSNRIDVDFIIKRLIKQNYQVDIYDIKQKKLFNCNSNSVLIKKSLPTFLEKKPIYLISNFILFIRFLLKNKSNYDICHIFFVREEQLLVPKLVRKVAPKLILTVYGSDYNRKNIIKSYFTKLYSISDAITATNKGLLDKIVENNMSLGPKTKALMFPQIRFNKFNDFDFKKKNIYKEKLGYNDFEKVIVVGTSAASYECHMEIIDELIKVDNSKLLFVFPMTYGTGDYISYRENISTYIKKKIKNYKILFDYMNEEELSELRKASDVLINLRKNDQLVASMLESLLVGCEVVTGDWLPYHILDEINVDMFKISKRSQLSSKLKEIINLDFNERETSLMSNRRAVFNRFSVEKDLDKWMDFYKNISK